MNLRMTGRSFRSLSNKGVRFIKTSNVGHWLLVMSRRYPPFRISTAALNLDAQIIELLGRWLVSERTVLAPKLRRDNRIRRPSQRRRLGAIKRVRRYLSPHN
jgi:hypothetical protein